MQRPAARSTMAYQHAYHPTSIFQRMILLYILISNAWSAVPSQESLWPKEKRFERLMSLTKGGSKYAKMSVDDFQHLILDGIQGEQKSDFTIIVTFNGLAPQFNCHLCKRTQSWMPNIATHTLQGDGENKVFYVWMDYSEETKQAYTVMQFQMVPGWFVFNGDGVLPPLTEAITAQQFNEAMPNYDATVVHPQAENSATAWLVKQFKTNSKKPLVIEGVQFKVPLRYDKIAFFGGLALTGLVVLCYYKYLFSRYAVGIFVTSVFCLFKSGFSQARIKNFKFGSFDTAFVGQSSTKWDSFIIAGIEFMFALALVALNAKGPKLVKNPILVVWLGALYCAYFWIYKTHKPNYPYSPYHLMDDYYTQF